MGFNFALILDIKSFKGMVHIKVNIIHIILYPNYMEFNLAPILLIPNLLYEHIFIWYIHIIRDK